MAASRSSRVTRSSVGINGLDENFCGRTLRNRSIAQPEEASALATPRARSPKKKQDNQQLQAGSHAGKVAEGRAEGEASAAHRKRGFSTSERDELERSDSCERAAATSESSPAPKKAKRCPRSGEAPGTEEEPSPKPESPADATRDIDEDSKSDAALMPAPMPAEEFGEERAKVVEGDTPLAQADEPHKATNGVAELHKEDLEAAALPAAPRACPAKLADGPSLPNGGQAPPTMPDPIVPCRSPPPGHLNEPDRPLVDGGGSCPAEEDADAHAVLSLEPEMEVEVDVVGDCGQTRDQNAEEGTNGGPPLEPLDPSDDGSNISGETAGHASSQPPAEPPSFTEPQEHRYALRTSPRRTPSIGSAAPASPVLTPGDNSLLKEEAAMGPFDLDDACYPELPTDGPRGAGETGSELSENVRTSSDAEGGGLDSSVFRSTKEPSLVQADEEEEEEEEEDPDVYYFESDHLALKHNKDYQRLLQTISVLEAQRTQAILDLETLACHQKQALANPIAFVDHLQKRVELGLPCPQRVVQLPEIAWDQYTLGRGEFERGLCDKKHKTRRLKLIFDKVGLPARPKSPVDSRKDGDGSTLYLSLPASDAPEQSMASNRTQMIRGRPYHQNKPDTFNQLWTVEEQKKLEQLLEKFPPEEVESKRWQKIADELGNRTAKQVASRVQKYFIKLTKAGIPVPGRTPNLCMYSKKASSKRQHHLNKHLYRPSTFLTSYEPPVYMDDEDERSSSFSGLPDHGADDSDEDSMPADLRHLPEYKELQELKRLRKQKIQELQGESSLAQHVGYKCDACGMEPIQGVRWHCQDCPQDSAIDFCGNCSDCLFKTETHKPNHRLEPVYQVETFLDRDYCLPHSTGYNYLDPNYFPANR
ncbi:ZZ-type zinc finger-containing protein 3 [Electrophorus electricus]|uniref:ZZ-type zinc finger-containing protein 3 n=1 Tax=Electrophorus electricus TaxID=8005 RepID=A0A4W4FIP8_ELEEL|nr:ZZ-type zinc finger-containing protein 3 [Electrophorus electricus]XP_035392058.1 ZZ-type zinc finger-containing protein 3 [Electrophorus electricus]